MKQRQLAVKIARYLVFECLEVLLFLATAGIFVLGQLGIMYLLTASQEIMTDHQIPPGPEEWISVLMIGLFLLAWIIVFYFWRRRAGLCRLIGQCITVLISAAAAVLWTVLAVSAVPADEDVFFSLVPCVLAVFGWMGTVFSVLPLGALIRWLHVQKNLQNDQNSMNSQ